MLSDDTFGTVLIHLTSHRTVQDVVPTKRCRQPSAYSRRCAFISRERLILGSLRMKRDSHLRLNQRQAQQLPIMTFRPSATSLLYDRRL